MTHPFYGPHFLYGVTTVGQSYLLNLIEVFTLFKCIRRYLRRPIMDRLRTLGVNFMKWDKDVPPWATSLFMPEVIRKTLITEIKADLDLSALDLALLRPYASDNYPRISNDIYVSLPLQWTWILRAKTELNRVKSQQWLRMADVITKYPGKIMLKKPLDPSQGGPRPNVKHIADHMVAYAAKALKDHKIHHEDIRKCRPGIDLIELIPYDRYLWLFLETMEKHPIDNDNPGDDVSSGTKPLFDADGTTTIPDSTGESDANTTFTYPEDIFKGIEVVMDGLMYLYTGSPLLMVPRIDWSPARGPYNPEGMPVFYINRKGHEPGLAASSHRCPVFKRKPHNEREYQWLEAFLKVVTWMEENLGEHAVTTKRDEEGAKN